MFIPEERKEAMRGIWGMMAWLMRAQVEAGDGRHGGAEGKRGGSGR